MYLFIYYFKFRVFIAVNDYFTFFYVRALWITTVYEMCYINKLALLYRLLISIRTEWYFSDRDVIYNTALLY